MYMMHPLHLDVRHQRLLQAAVGAVHLMVPDGPLTTLQIKVVPYQDRIVIDRPRLADGTPDGTTFDRARDVLPMFPVTTGQGSTLYAAYSAHEHCLYVADEFDPGLAEKPGDEDLR